MAVSALAPAALVGVASYMIVQRIQTEQVTARLGERAASAERQISHFLETRWSASHAMAASPTLAAGIESWNRARSSGDTVEQARARARLERFLSSARQQDAAYRGLALYDDGGRLLASSAPVADWSPAPSLDTAAAVAGGVIRVSGPPARVHLERTIRGDRPAASARLLTVSTLEPLWRGFTALYDDIPARLRIVDGRRQILFDSDAYPQGPREALPAPLVERLLELRIGHAAYADGAGEIVAAHRFMPSLEFGALVELAAEDASSFSRRWREFALGGSLATVTLLAVLASALAFATTRPLRALAGAADGAAAGDPSYRIPVDATGEVGSLTITINQLLDALEKASRRLERVGRVDELTGLYNRRHLDERFSVELNRSSRARTPLSVLMIDLDHFQAFNDRFGREQGDAFLQHVSSFLKTWLRATDVLARYGGEEFAALLPDTDLATAVEVAERLRSGFEESHPSRIDRELAITLSIGVATWQGGATVRRDLIQAADGALGDAKRNGRNQVRVAA